MIRVFCSDQYVSAGYDFDTTRKAKWVADSLIESPIPGIELASPLPLTREQIMQVHDAYYIRAIETGIPSTLAESQGFSWDTNLWPMVCASNGGVTAAALAALECGIAGSLSSGMHHARQDAGEGYCTFNGLVIAAKGVLAAGTQSVLILDLDAHCGGGTHSLIEVDSRIWQIDVSVNRYDRYESSDHVWLFTIRSGEDYLPTVERLLRAVERRRIRFDLCLYNAGMDPFEKCSPGGMSGITKDDLASREQMVFKWCRKQNIPIAFVLAGGYIGPRLEKEELVQLHRLTLSAAVESHR